MPAEVIQNLDLVYLLVHLNWQRHFAIRLARNLLP